MNQRGEQKQENIVEFQDAIKFVFDEMTLKEIEKNQAYKDICQASVMEEVDYGDSEQAREIMLIIRKKMRENGLAPNEKLVKDKEYTACEKYPKNFRDRYREVIAVDKGHYKEDGWDYNADKYEDEDWIIKSGEIYTHLYYNELDHYFTHLIKRIECGQRFSTRDEGLKKMRDEIKRECKLFCVNPLNRC